MTEEIPDSPVPVATNGMHPQDTANAKSAGSPTDPLPATQTSPPPKTERETESCRPDQTPLWKVILETGAVFVGLYVAVVYSGQLTQMIESNKLSRDSLYALQRPFIISQKPTTETPTYNVINGVQQKTLLKMIEFTYHWENVGNTPAIGIVTTVGKVVQPDEITEQEFTATQIDRTAAKSAIGPKATLDSGTLRDDETFLTDNPGVPRFMWGWMVYRDTFPNTKPHVTEWCWKITEIAWELDINGKHAGKPHLTASACVHHNCVDEFCEDYANITALSPAN